MFIDSNLLTKLILNGWEANRGHQQRCSLKSTTNCYYLHMQMTMEQCQIPPLISDHSMFDYVTNSHPLLMSVQLTIPLPTPLSRWVWMNKISNLHTLILLKCLWIWLLACIYRFNHNPKACIDGASFPFGRYWIMPLSPHPTPVFSFTIHAGSFTFNLFIIKMFSLDKLGPPLFEQIRELREGQKIQKKKNPSFHFLLM